MPCEAATNVGAEDCSKTRSAPKVRRRFRLYLDRYAAEGTRGSIQYPWSQSELEVNTHVKVCVVLRFDGEHTLCSHTEHWRSFGSCRGEELPCGDDTPA